MAGFTATSIRDHQLGGLTGRGCISVDALFPLDVTFIIPQEHIKGAHPECLTELVRYAVILKGAKDPYWELKTRPPKDFDKTWKKLGLGDIKNIYK